MGQPRGLTAKALAVDGHFWIDPMGIADVAHLVTGEPSTWWQSGAALCGFEVAGETMRNADADRVCDTCLARLTERRLTELETGQ